MKNYLLVVFGLLFTLGLSPQTVKVAGKVLD